MKNVSLAAKIISKTVHLAIQDGPSIKQKHQVSIHVKNALINTVVNVFQLTTVPNAKTSTILQKISYVRIVSQTVEYAMTSLHANNVSLATS